MSNDNLYDEILKAIYSANRSDWIDPEDAEEMAHDIAAVVRRRAGDEP